MQWKRLPIGDILLVAGAIALYCLAAGAVEIWGWCLSVRSQYDLAVQTQTPGEMLIFNQHLRGIAMRLLEVLAIILFYLAALATAARQARRTALKARS